MAHHSTSIFKKSYEEGIQNEFSDFDSWLAKFNLNCILLNKFSKGKSEDLFFNRHKEIEKIAKIIGIQERQSNFGYLNIVGVSGVGKSVFLSMINSAYAELNPDKVPLRINARKFFEQPDICEEDEEKVYYEIFLDGLCDKRLIIIDDCEEDYMNMHFNLRDLMQFHNQFFIFSWRPLHWRKFNLKMQDNFNINTEPIFLKPFNKEEMYKFLSERLHSIRSNKSVEPFDSETLKRIAELSKGLPRLGLSLCIKSLRRTFMLNKDKVTVNIVEEVYHDEGFSELIEFLNTQCNQITRKILKRLILQDGPKGTDLDSLAEEVELDRTTVFYHMKKIRKLNILNEIFQKKTVLFSVKNKYLPLVELFLWEQRVGE